MGNENIVDFQAAKEKKSVFVTEPIPGTDEWFDREEYTISKLEKVEQFSWDVSELWNNIYVGKKVSHFVADDDGRIHYRAVWPSHRLETDHEYESSLQEHMRLMLDFINEKGLSVDFFKLYEEKIADKHDVLKLLILK